MTPPIPSVLATSAIHPDGAALLAPHANLVTAPDNSAETLRKMAQTVDGIIVRDKLPDDIFEAAGQIRGVVRHGVGLDFIPVDAATARRVPVANLPGSNTQAVAEYCISAMFHLRRPLRMLDAAHRNAGWGTARGLTDTTFELAGSTLGIVGVGNIGGHLAKVARQAFGMNVIGVSRRPGRMPEGVEEASIEQLFARSDVIVICCALTNETRGLVDAALLARMRPDAILINVSRGPVVRTEALSDALKGKRIGGACIDVYDQHPLPAESTLFDTPNLILTPHAASLTKTTTRAMSIAAVQEMVRLLNGEPPLNLVNPAARDNA